MTTATKITLVRIFMIPAFIVTMYLSGGTERLWCLVSFFIFVAASITDFIDGYIARRYDQTTDLGKFLDPLADKMLTVAAFCIFCEWGRFPAWAVVIVLCREFAVTGLRLIAVQKDKVIAAGWSGKVKTASTMIGLCLMLFFSHPVLDMVVVYLTVATTLYSGTEYFVRNWRCLCEPVSK